MRNVLIVGAGYIANTHAEVLQDIPDVRLWGIVDTNEAAARSFARRWSVPNVFTSIDDALATGHVQCAHVATPPSTHEETALPLLRAKIPVLVEKPLAATSTQCDTLNSIAGQNRVALGANQNFVFHPAFVRLRRLVNAGVVGRPRSIDYIYNMPLRQFTSRQFGHWMFDAPLNLLLEQAVHPLSQIAILARGLDCVAAVPVERPLNISSGVFLYRSLNLTLKSDAMPVQLHFAVGQSFPFWQMSVICDDGVVVADMSANRVSLFKRTRWIDPIDHFLSGAQIASRLTREAARNIKDFAFSTLKLAARRDTFFLSMKESLNSFHGALRFNRDPELDGRFGASLVAICENAARLAAFPPAQTRKAARQSEYDVVVLGGTGFIGQHVVERLLDRGHRVGVLARSIRNLPPIFGDERIVVLRGDVRQRSDVERSIGSATCVINLAHGGGGSSFEEVRAAMVGSAENVAQVCMEKKVRKLIHVGSIASLYLGRRGDIIPDKTPPDPRSDLRGDYSRAKAECDRVLLSMGANEGLPITIMRPGVVVGRGGIPMHGALGFFNNDQHCIGWSRGRNPLPLVLVDDVADAIVAACDSDAPLSPTYNLVGDVRLSARQYIKTLGRALGRPLRFHPQTTTTLWVKELGKWLIKRAIGRRSARPTLYDFRSRSLVATFDCGSTKRDLGWCPESNNARFITRGIEVYADDAYFG